MTQLSFIDCQECDYQMVTLNERDSLKLACTHPHAVRISPLSVVDAVEYEIRTEDPAVAELLQAEENARNTFIAELADGVF